MCHSQPCFVLDDSDPVSTEAEAMYSRKMSFAARPRYGDHWSRGIVRGPFRIPTQLSKQSPLEGCSLPIGWRHVRCASIRTIFKLWQQQGSVMPVYSKKVESNPDFAARSPPSSDTTQRGGGSSASNDAKKRVTSVDYSYTRHTNDPHNKRLDIEAIEALIRERNKLKKERNYERADVIRENLKRFYGVHLNDGERVWGTNATEFMGYLGTSTRLHDYQLCDDAGPSKSPLSFDKIHKLIAERMQYRQRGDFERADKIKDIFYENYVAIDDYNRLWRSDGEPIYTTGTGNEEFPYTYAPDAGPKRTNMDEEDVVRYLADRRVCLYNRSFYEAETIRTILQNAGVQFDDETRTWRADGKLMDGREFFDEDDDRVGRVLRPMDVEFIYNTYVAPLARGHGGEYGRGFEGQGDDVDSRNLDNEDRRGNGGGRSSFGSEGDVGSLSDEGREGVRGSFLEDEDRENRDCTSGGGDRKKGDLGGDRGFGRERER
jgi:hypothetical protein